MGNLATTGSKSTDKEEMIDPRCIVKFRPADDWTGDYGFDWFREGDYGENPSMGNPKFSHYVNDSLVGKYVTYIDGKCYQFVRGVTQDPDNTNATNSRFENSLTRKNRPFALFKDFFLKNNYSTAILKGHENDVRYSYGSRYIVPTISLFYENTAVREESWGKSVATINLLISGGSIVTDIRNLTLEIDCSEGINLLNSQGGLNILSFDKTSGCYKISGADVGSKVTYNNQYNYYKFNVDIKLTVLFSYYSIKEGDGSIKVYAKNNSNDERFLAGKLIVKKCVPQSVDIILVPISVQFNSSVQPSIVKDMQEQANNLKRFLNQAQIIPNIYTATFFSQKKIKELDDIINKYTQRDSNNNAIALDPNQQTTILDKLFNRRMGEELESLFNQEYSKLSSSNRIKNAYKIFLFAVDGRHKIDDQGRYTGGRLIGQGTGIPSKSAVLFSLPNWNKTAIICHELLHCFGLYHTFSNRSPFTLEYLKTSNIMDYPDSDFELQTLGKWQWDEIRSADGVKSRNDDLGHVLPKVKLKKK